MHVGCNKRLTKRTAAIVLVKQSCLKGNNEMLDQGSELPVIIKPGRTHGRRKTLSVEERRERERERERGGGTHFCCMLLSSMTEFEVTVRFDCD